jgi:hypothetical protein
MNDSVSGINNFLVLVIFMSGNTFKILLTASPIIEKVSSFRQKRLYFTPRNMLDKINRSIKQAKEGNATTIKTADELNLFLDNL